MLTSGESVAGFEVVHRLGGESGMGVVYEAADAGGDERVALKVFPGELSDRPGFRKRFKDEVPRQAAVDHPHVVPILQAGNSDQGLYLAMQLVRGPNLKELIPSRGLEPERALAILTPVAEALDAVHEDGLLHHDVKPEKILVVTGDDEAFLAGFGIGHQPLGTGAPTRRDGALYYLSPEEIRGETASSASEVYAFAAVVFEALTGGPPFTGRSEQVVLDGHLNEPPPRASARRSRLPTGVDQALVGGLAKDPRERPRSAGELMREVEHGLRTGEGEKLAPSAAQVSAALAAGAKVEGSRPTVEGSSRKAGGSGAGPRRRMLSAVVRRLPVRRLGAALALVVLTATAVAAGWVVSERMSADGAPASGAATPGGATAPPRSASEARPAAPASRGEAEVLNQTVLRLNERRQTLRARLARARTPEGQGAVCASLARAYESAVDALVAPTLTAQQRRASSGVVAALERTSDAYGRMASAAVVGDRAAFGRTGREVQRLEEAVRAEVQRAAPGGASGSAPEPPS